MLAVRAESADRVHYPHPTSRCHRLHQQSRNPNTTREANMKRCGGIPPLRTNLNPSIAVRQRRILNSIAAHRLCYYSASLPAAPSSSQQLPEQCQRKCARELLRLQAENGQNARRISTFVPSNSLRFPDSVRVEAVHRFFETIYTFLIRLGHTVASSKSEAKAVKGLSILRPAETNVL